ncbi:MAG: carboxypeptidase regulatory-like domain-containing protein [Flavobacteriales bacterium]|nr:carboxypeptidase regulatory-like domain-containing protein [Flavobacteriales bacterium]
MRKFILLIAAIAFLSAPTFAQDEEESKYHIGKETKIKDPIPGVGMIKGAVHALHYLEHLPETQIDVADGRMIEVDKHGHFEFDIDVGTHKITFSHKGFKDLVVEKVVITEGHETHINVGLLMIEEAE